MSYKYLCEVVSVLITYLSSKRIIICESAVPYRETYNRYQNALVCNCVSRVCGISLDSHNLGLDGPISTVQ